MECQSLLKTGWGRRGQSSLEVSGSHRAVGAGESASRIGDTAAQKRPLESSEV